MVQLILILDNLRSAHNVGAILRTADAVGVEKVMACGSTPYPAVPGDTRDPVISNRNTRQIAKTALGAERTVLLEHYDDTITAITTVRAQSWTIIGLEQSPESVNIMSFPPPANIALVVGNEVTGLSRAVLKACDAVVEIPQHGRKESLNVSVATGVALYQLLN